MAASSSALDRGTAVAGAVAGDAADTAMQAAAVMATEGVPVMQAVELTAELPAARHMLAHIAAEQLAGRVGVP